MVLRVDKEKGYIDLSKRRVSPEDVAAAEERFNKSKMVRCGWSGLTCMRALSSSGQACVCGVCTAGRAHLLLDRTVFLTRWTDGGGHRRHQIIISLVMSHKAWSWNCGYTQRRTGVDQWIIPGNRCTRS